MRRARSATYLTVSMMAITLTLMGLFLVLTVNVQRIVTHFKERMSLEVFIAPGLDETVVQGLRTAIARVEGVESVAYISPEQALEHFRKELGEDPLAILGENPLPPSFQVRVKAEERTPTGIERIAGRVMRVEHVDEVVYNSRLFEAVNRYSNVVILVDGALFVFVFVSAIILVANTLRLTILSQQGMIQIMRLVGATRGFIRRPYVIQGIIQGGIAGAVGSAVVWGLMTLVSVRFPQLLESSLTVAVAPFLGGALLGYTGSWIAVKRFLVE